jgi:hypothetical protein
MYLRLAWNSICSAGWPQFEILLALASWVLGL